jgi:acetoacetate decarboxylase
LRISYHHLPYRSAEIARTAGMHIIADLTLPLGKVVHDYLA